MENLRLWGCGTSRTLRPHWVLNELGIAYEIEPLFPRSDEAESADFGKLNASHKVPVLDDNGFILTESAAISIYIAEKPGNHALMPESREQRIRCLQWCFFAMMELDAHTLYIIAKHAGKLLPIYGESPQAVSVAREGFAAQIGVFGQKLDDGRPWILGEQFTVADILLGACELWSQEAASMGEILRIPHSVESYAARLQARAGYALALKANYPR